MPVSAYSPGRFHRVPRGRCTGSPRRSLPTLEQLEHRTLLSFAPPVTFPVASSPNSVAVADLTNNGKLDIITANPDTGVSVLLGDGKGGFPPAPGSPFMTASGPQSVAVGDFNGDG